jgi:hypothetical protein
MEAALFAILLRTNWQPLMIWRSVYRTTKGPNRENDYERICNINQ